ncbi:uncharacterized protein LOC119413949 [Nematolebias whitei]|uniref:uncharacterized protein LOC119413949 n=1 Tax=Nematolebias whitei TaxID=451745 RepID=UPI00189BEDFC|nr:uncharacterized protein LOC119413949 [Nematolebias whitei]
MVNPALSSRHPPVALFALTLCPHQSSSWMKEMQMVCRVVVLLILSSCLCAATFVVNVTQSSSQAEQNHNITLEWTFTTTPERSWRDLFIYCSLLAPLRESVLYLVQEGVEVSQFQDEQFAGRVQGDKDVLREGRIRLHLSSLRTEDSGTYKCEVRTKDGSGYQMCRLDVSGRLTRFIFLHPRSKFKNKTSRARASKKLRSEEQVLLRGGSIPRPPVTGGTWSLLDR